MVIRIIYHFSCDLAPSHHHFHHPTMNLLYVRPFKRLLFISFYFLQLQLSLFIVFGVINRPGLFGWLIFILQLGNFLLLSVLLLDICLLQQIRDSFEPLCAHLLSKKRLVKFLLAHLGYLLVFAALEIEVVGSYYPAEIYVEMMDVRQMVIFVDVELSYFRALRMDSAIFEYLISRHRVVIIDIKSRLRLEWYGMFQFVLAHMIQILTFEKSKLKQQLYSQLITHDSMIIYYNNLWVEQSMSNTNNFSCNGNIFKYNHNIQQNPEADTETGFLLGIIIICFITLLFFLYKMFRLCSLAFSYSNYHIHSTYRVYALAIITIISTMIFRNNQWNILVIQIELEKGEIYVDLVGYEILNNIIGIMNLFTNNIMQIFYSITWLSIALNCDYTVEEQTDSSFASQLGERQSTDTYSHYKITKNRIRIKYFKLFILYCLMPVMFLLSIIGTLIHKEGDDWCEVVNVSIVVSSVFPLIIFGLAFGLYLKKFSDPQISLKIKIGLVYLFIQILTRTIFYLVIFIKIDDQDTITHNVGTLLYVIFFTLSPMIVMVFLSEIQLRNEQLTCKCWVIVVLKRSSVLMFKSTLM